MAISSLVAVSGIRHKQKKASWIAHLRYSHRYRQSKLCSGRKPAWKLDRRSFGRSCWSARDWGQAEFFDRWDVQVTDQAFLAYRKASRVTSNRQRIFPARQLDRINCSSPISVQQYFSEANFAGSRGFTDRRCTFAFLLRRSARSLGTLRNPIFLAATYSESSISIVSSRSMTASNYLSLVTRYK